MILFSLIIPVYGVEQYIGKCLNSILSQSYNNWEALLIDDGSSDDSGKICDEYAAKDSRFKVFHKANGGVSTARNVGLANACGDWIWFVDPDDWIAEDALKILSDTVRKNNCDTVFFGIDYIGEDGTLIGIEDRNLVLDKSKNETIMAADYPPQNYLLKRSLVEMFGLRFSEGIHTGEDLEFQYKYLMVCNAPISIDRRLYRCLRREGSAMRNPRTLNNMAQGSPKILRHLVDFIMLNNIKESSWLASRLNRTFKFVMSSNYIVSTYRNGVQEVLKDANKRLKIAGFKYYSDAAVKIGVADIRLYFMFQTLRKLIRK